MARCSCAGDSDPQLLAARAGLARLAGPPPVRKRMRRGRLLHVLAQCITEERYIEGAALSLGYVFGLRVPSELNTSMILEGFSNEQSWQKANRTSQTYTCASRRPGNIRARSGLG